MSAFARKNPLKFNEISGIFLSKLWICSTISGRFPACLRLAYRLTAQLEQNVYDLISTALVSGLSDAVVTAVVLNALPS